MRADHHDMRPDPHGLPGCAKPQGCAANTLVLVNREPRSVSDGYDLRVLSLCRFVEGQRHLLVVPLTATQATTATLDVDAVFASREALPPFDGAPSVRRHLRRSDADFLRLAYPRSFDSAIRRIRAVIAERGIERMIVFGSNLAGLARAVAFRHTLLDVCDSVALTVARQYRHDAARLSTGARARARLHLWRSRRCEAALPSWFAQVTTINRADSDELARLHGSGTDNVHTVPNGVGDVFLQSPQRMPSRRGVAFWGNLGFAPNREAVRWFVDSVYRPYLQPARVEVCIIGSGADAWLLDRARHAPGLSIRGFVDDLPSALADYPVMINPMLIGSGLKNKVLEAFALGLAVVSTTLGVEAFSDALPGRHYLAADEPAAFARAVLELVDDESRWRSMRADARALLERSYRWEVVGRRWNELCRQV